MRAITSLTIGTCFAASCITTERYRRRYTYPSASGRYGNPYSSESINNPYGAGNPYRSDSPNNPYGTGWEIVDEDESSTDYGYSAPDYSTDYGYSPPDYGYSVPDYSDYGSSSDDDSSYDYGYESDAYGTDTWGNTDDQDDGYSWDDWDE